MWKAKRSAPRFVFCALGICAASAIEPCFAQQRSFINLGFEQPSLGGLACWRQVPDTLVPGWSTTDPASVSSGDCPYNPASGRVPRIEMWGTGFLGVAARSGQQFAELNATSSSRQTQRICLLNGETVQWRFSHRGRASATVPDVMRFLVTSAPAIEVVEVRTTSSGGAGSGFASHFESIDQGTATFANAAAGWVDYFRSFVYRGPSGIQGIGFEAVSSGSGNVSAGNLLDEIQVTLRPFVEFNGGTSNAPESNTPATSLPRIRISGQSTVATVVQVRATGGTAVLGTDFTTPTGRADFTITIPAGNYDPTSAASLFPLGVAILNDAITEGNETIEFAIAQQPDAYNIASTTTCGSPAIATATHTIVDDEAPSLALAKTGAYQDSNNNGVADVGDRIAYGFVVTNTGTATLTQVSIADALAGVALSGNPIALAPGASDSTTFTATYALTQADIDAGQVVNNAIASGRDSQNAVVNSPRSAATVPLQRTPNVSVSKVVDATRISAPATLNYTITVRNTGNTRLSGIVVADTLPDASAAALVGPSGDGGVAGVLDVAEAWTYATSFAVGQARYDGGADQVNRVSVTSTQTDTPRTAAATTQIDRIANLSITKTNTFAAGPGDQSGDTVVSGASVTYDVVVANAGPATATGAVVRDSVRAGLLCPAANPVACTGQPGACGGPYTVGGLTGSNGIVLGAVPQGANVRLTFTCTVQ